MNMLDSIQPPKSPTLPPRQSSTAKRKSWFRLTIAIVMLILLVVGIFVGSKLVIFAQKILEGSGTTFSFGKFFLAADKSLIGEKDGEIRILLLGIGGENHEGGTLTDTMIVATIKLPQNKTDEPQVSLFSIPRDLLVDIPGYDFRKINAAYALAEAAEKGKGAAKAVTTVEKLLEASIPYYIVVDFQGFKKIIDDLGEVEVDVEQPFTDELYPDEKNGYLPPVTFEKGKQTMDGTRALKYVRSRHGSNNQGSDFARTKRQQQVLKALKDKSTSFKVLTNLNLLSQVLEDLSDHIRTNLALHELKHLYDLARGLKRENILSQTLDVESGVLCNKTVEETGAYVLIPCADIQNYSVIRNLFDHQFELAPLLAESASIEIQNTSQVESLGRKIQENLGSSGLHIETTNFKGQTTYTESIIYDNTDGKKPKTLAYLRKTLTLPVAQSPFPFPTFGQSPDFVIIITRDMEGKLP